MGQLFDRALRKGFSDVFDSAYGGSALENRLKGALASSLYDARLSSSGYNQARTRTVEDELANRQSLRKRLVEGGDPNALDRFDIGPGHAQDYMKGRVGSAKEDRLVKELQRLQDLGTSKGMDYRSGAITGSNRGQIGAGRLSEGKMGIARETQDALTAALATMKSADRSTPAGEKIHQDALTEALMLTEKTGNLSSIQQIESKIGATEALTGQREAIGKAATSKADTYAKWNKDKIELDTQIKNKEVTIKELVGKSKVKKNEAAADMYGEKGSAARSQAALYDAKVFDVKAAKNLKEGKLKQVNEDIKNEAKKLKADIKRIDQLIKSGQIVDKKVQEDTKFLGEKMKTELKKREVMGETVKKIQTEVKKMEAVIAKVTAQTKGEHVDIGLKIAEFLGVGKPPSGDSLLNNYTKMYVQIMEEDPILLSGGEPIVINKTDDNPEGQKKLFSHLNSDEQKSYVQTRMINARAKAYTQSSEPIHPIIQSMIETWTKVEKGLVEELAMSPTGDQAVSPDEGPPAQTDGQPPAIAQSPAAVDTGSDLTSALGQLSGTGEMQFDDSQVADALRARNAGVNQEIADVQSQPVQVQGADLGADQAQSDKRTAVTMLKEAGFPQNATEFISDAFVSKAIDQNDMMQMMKNNVKINRDLLKKAKATPNAMPDAVMQVLEHVIEWQESALGLTNALQGQP